MPELPGMAISQGRPNPAEQGDAAGSDADADGAAILGRTPAGNKAALGQVVDHARDVRSARHKPASEFQCQSGPWMIGPQQAQQVVLLRREIELAEEFVFQPTQTIVRSPEIQEDFLLERVEALASGLRD